MAKNQGIKRVLWALDAFENPDETRAHVVAAIRTLLKNKGVKVEPVYVLSPDQLDISFELSPPWREKYRPAAEKALDQLVKEANVRGLMKPHVIFHSRPSLTGAVQALNTYGRSVGADLIIVGTHARSGLPRLFLGSFAETLLQYSKTPVLVVGGESRVADSFDHILFATDFGKKSQAAYERVLKIAKIFHAKVTLFHSIPNPIEPVFQSGVYLLGGGWVPVVQYLKTEEIERKKLGETWIKKAKKLGVDARLEIDTDGKGVVESVNHAAEHGGAKMIAMAAQSGPIASVVIGSVTRMVTRNSKVPVWVLRSSK